MGEVSTLRYTRDGRGINPEIYPGYERVNHCLNPGYERVNLCLNPGRGERLNPEVYPGRGERLTLRYTRVLITWCICPGVDNLVYMPGWCTSEWGIPQGVVPQGGVYLRVINVGYSSLMHNGGYSRFTVG